MTTDRPDPDQLLVLAHEAEARARRGKLTVFFGAAPGVGKTYAMLEAARLEKEGGRDVVVGLVETHGRYDTGALLLGHEVMPRRTFEHRGISLREFDLDGALARRPGLLLVDELAHTNASGCRHAKRWQDVQEILDAGIDVYTTLNVQHLESLTDVVTQITRVRVRETVPDAIFEQADDVRLLDFPIDELLERMREGKVYAPDQAELARENFFQPGNLFALRELALRLTAQRVDAQLRHYRAEHGIDRTWPVVERILVCVSPSPASEHLVRGARRLAASARGDWLAVYVETPASLRLGAADRERIGKHLALAQSLGAETVTLSGERAAEAILRFARSRNVTRVLLGKPSHARWRDRLSAPFLDELVRSSGDIDVQVLAVETPAVAPTPGKHEPPSNERHVDHVGILAAFFVIACVTVACQFAFGRNQIADVAMAYVLGIVLVSVRWGFGPSILAAVLGVLSFDFFFIPPFFTFAVADFDHIVTFAVMFVVAGVISGLTRRVHDQAEAARERELRTSSLYALSGALAAAKTVDDVCRASGRHLADVFATRVAIFLPGAGKGAGGLEQASPGEAWAYDAGERERAVADWVWKNGHEAGLGTQTLPAAAALYLPLQAASTRLGALGLVPREAGAPAPLERRRHLEAFVRQIAIALERMELAKHAREAELRIEAEELRNALLSSVSHDLRTPLAVITGTASALLERSLDDSTRRELTESIASEAEHLNRLVRNLLDMTRLEAGAVKVRKEWQPIEEAIGAALDRTSGLLGARPVKTRIDDEAVLVPFDSLLLQQVLGNLLENASKYTPPGTEIEITATADAKATVLSVLDRGPGLPEGDHAKVFEKFYRGHTTGAGVGLGLTICKGIIEAHGGRIWVEDRAGGGAAFRFSLPLEGEPPAMDVGDGAQPAREDARP